MKRRLTNVVTIICALILAFSSAVSASAATEADTLKMYNEKLADINEKLGTQYKIPTREELTATDMTFQELIDFYTTMTLEEFETYILEMHTKNMSDNETSTSVSK